MCNHHLSEVLDPEIQIHVEAILAEQSRPLDQQDRLAIEDHLAQIRGIKARRLAEAAPRRPMDPVCAAILRAGRPTPGPAFGLGFFQAAH